MPSGAVHFLFYFTSDRRRTGVKHFSLYRVNRDMPGVRLKLVCNARRKVKDVRHAGLASLSGCISIVAFCSSVFATGQELWDPQLVHDRLIKAGYGLCRMTCWNAFLAMYFKCRNMEDALSVFEEMKERMYNFM
jgi:pentatricopeptide repeat protein